MAKAKFDIKTEATRSLLAGVGAADLAVETVRDYIAEFSAKALDVQKDVQKKAVDVQKDVQKRAFDVQKKAADVPARRAAIEARVLELQEQLQAEAKAFPSRVQSLVSDNVITVNDTYADLAKRGEVLVGRIRKQESTQATVKSAKTTVAKAKTTKTQAENTAKSTVKTAKKAAKPAKKSAATSSAKATATAAKKTAAHAVDAVADATEKIGD